MYLNIYMPLDLLRAFYSKGGRSMKKIMQIIVSIIALTVMAPGHAKEVGKQSDLDCLAKNIYYEAAMEPYEGKLAVAQVTMNRLNHPDYPSDVCGVIYQKTGSTCQFSWVCMPGVFNRPVYSALYKESEEVAKKVLFENFRLPSLTHAMYYHADYVNPGWRREKIAVIGRYIFYK